MTTKTNYNNFDSLSSKPSYAGKETPSSSSSNKISEKTCEYLIPLLVPVTTAFVGWYANRKYAAKVKQNEALKGELTRLLEDIRDAPNSLPSVEDKSKRAEILKEEDKELNAIHKDLDEISTLLEKRQDIYCSAFTRRENRHKIEEDLKSFAFSRTYDKDIRLYSGLVDIFQFDSHCDNYGSHRNGCMMWVYMDMWRNMARLRKCQRIESRMSEEEAQ